jgi:energy-coupling factor transporter transmembrane protein EcfT
MGNRWHLRDYVFAAFMTIGMVIAVFIVGPFAPPGFKLLAWAPLGGIFLTLGMARLHQLPNFIVLSLILTWRFLPLLQQEAQRIIEANWLRGVNLTRQPTQLFSGLFLPLIFRIVAYADEVTVGLETRGYDPTAPRTNSQPLRWHLKDTIFAASATAILVVVGYLEWAA